MSERGITHTIGRQKEPYHTQHVGEIQDFIREAMKPLVGKYTWPEIIIGFQAWLCEKMFGFVYKDGHIYKDE